MLKELKRDIDDNKLSKRVLNSFTENTEQGIDLIAHNLNRASELVSSFKQVAVDQVSDKIRKVNMSKYLNEIIHSLHPKLKNTQHSINVDCPDNIEIYCHAGALAQIFTNLVINSLIHGFKAIDSGIISIQIKQARDFLHITYKDNGHGLSEEQMTHLFDAFYTTNANQGGSGLGTHIVQNLVQDTLNGEINVTSALEEGLQYDIKFRSME